MVCISVRYGNQSTAQGHRGIPTTQFNSLPFVTETLNVTVWVNLDDLEQPHWSCSDYSVMVDGGHRLSTCYGGWWSPVTLSSQLISHRL